LRNSTTMMSFHVSTSFDEQGFRYRVFGRGAKEATIFVFLGTTALYPNAREVATARGMVKRSGRCPCVSKHLSLARPHKGCFRAAERKERGGGRGFRRLRGERRERKGESRGRASSAMVKAQGRDGALTVMRPDECSRRARRHLGRITVGALERLVRGAFGGERGRGE
jgi:hypothetical protein